MNLFFPFWTMLPFLDIAITPRSTSTPVPTQAAEGGSAFSLEPIFPMVLIIFLIFIGFLIWNSLKKKK